MRKPSATLAGKINFSRRLSEGKIKGSRIGSKNEESTRGPQRVSRYRSLRAEIRSMSAMP